MTLLTDPANLLTKLSSRLNYGDYLPGSNPVVEAARQRLAGTQQNLLGQNMMVQQQQQQQQQQIRQMRILSALQNSQQTSYLPAGVNRNYQGIAPAGQIRSWINQALQVTGNTGRRHDSLVNGLYNMIMHESGGNPNAQNNWDSNAKAGTPSIGLMQTILPTFNQYAVAGHRNVRNPVDNIIAGLRYALRNYGYGMVEGGGRHDAYGNYLGY